MLCICEISGKQYKISPNIPFEVDFLGDVKEIEANVLLALGDEFQLGKPYLDKKIKLTCQGTVSKDKIRVAKYHSKANYRKVTGIRPKKTQLVWVVKKQ